MIGERVDGGGGVHSFANESGAEAGDAVRLPAFAPGVRHTFVQDAAGGARTVCAHAPGDGLAGLLCRARLTRTSGQARLWPQRHAAAPAVTRRPAV